MKLSAQGIAKKYPRKLKDANFFYAVQPTDFTLESGAVTEIIGRSGSGKTTLLNMLSGLLSPSEGQVLLDGEDLYSQEDKALSVLRNQHLGVVPQGQTGLNSLTVLENVLLPYALYHKDNGAEAYAKELLEAVGIAALADAYPDELSGGEVRRLAIARALIMKPAIILADEPTGDLDDENTAVVLQLFRRLADEGASVLMVTHEAEAKQYADHIYKMSSGTLEKVSEG
ncbi:MAG: ABC transporter ATP-binding protein [Eubacterium sp.]|nr:ABC transporter ATP-binding protein [Eubacterium sp.]